MSVHGPRPPSTPGRSSGLSAVAHGPHLAGDGTAASPLDLAAAAAARLDGLHDAMRERVGAWDMTAAAVRDGSIPPQTTAYGYRNVTNDAPTDAPSLVTGAIAPAPPELRRGSDTWRIVALTQLTGGGRTVELILGAPSTDRRVAAPTVDVAAADTWVAVPGVVVDAARLTTYTLRIAGGAAQYVRADTLRALTAAAAGGDATAAGTSHALAGGYGLGLTATRGLLVAAGSAAGRVVVAVDADDGPSTAEAAEVPDDVDWRIGDTVLRTRDATRTYAPRSTLGGRHWESSRSLTWSDVPAGTIAAGTVEVTALGPSVEARGVVVGDTAPDHPPLGLVWIDTSDEDDVVLRWWDGYSWDVVLQGGLQYGTRLPATPAGGRLYVLTADDGAHTEGLYAALDAGVWTRIGGGPAQSQQSTILRPATWARAWIRAATEAAALAGVAAATWTDDGPGTPPTGAYWSLDDVPAGAARLYELVSLVSAAHGPWTFSPWSAIELTAENTQYSADGSTGWHAVRATEDRYERHRDALGAWSAAIPLYAADEVVWSTIVSTVIQAVGTHQPGVLIALPSQIALHRIALMRFRMRTETSGYAPVLESDLVIRPDWLTAALWSARASVTDDVHTLILTLEARGLGLVSAGFNLGAGPADSGGAAGLKLRLIRPAPPVISHSQDASHLAVYYAKNQTTRHVLQIDVM